MRKRRRVSDTLPTLRVSLPLRAGLRNSLPDSEENLKIDTDADREARAERIAKNHPLNCQTDLNAILRDKIIELRWRYRRGAFNALAVACCKPE